jgi:hypothetical protein
MTGPVEQPSAPEQEGQAGDEQQQEDDQGEQ